MLTMLVRDVTPYSSDHFALSQILVWTSRCEMRHLHVGHVQRATRFTLASAAWNRRSDWIYSCRSRRCAGASMSGVFANPECIRVQFDQPQESTQL